jgi:glutathione synthase/RimK-type ligase-like ATP-grasp enzyme
VPDLVLITGHDMDGRDVETPLLVAALATLGVTAVIRPWGDDLGRLDPRLIVIRTPWDYSTRYDEFIEWVRSAAAVRPMVNPAEVIVWNSHKSYLLQLAERGVPVVPTTLVPAGGSPATLAGRRDEVVIKPAVSVGANRTVQVRSDSIEAANHLAAILAADDALVQPYLPEITTGEVSLIYFGDRFSHAVRKTPAAGDFRVQTYHGGIVEAYRPSEAELAVGRASIEAVDATLGYARVDVVTTSSGPLLMELELLEPQLFLDLAPELPERFAKTLAGWL